MRWAIAGHLLEVGDERGLDVLAVEDVEGRADREEDSTLFEIGGRRFLDQLDRPVGWGRWKDVGSARREGRYQ